MHEARVWVDALAIPTEQRGYGEGATQVMEPGGNHAWWNLQLQLGQEPMERLADRPRMDAAPLCEREQRRLGLALLAVTLSYVASDAIGQLGSERHDSTLVELGFADEQRVSSKIDIFQLQAGYLADTQPQTIEQGEHSLVNQCSM